MAKELPLRSEIEAEFKWSLEDIYHTDADWEEDFKKLEGMLPGVEKFRGKLASSSQNLLEGLETIVSLQEIINRLYAYSHMSEDQDTANQHYQAMNNRAQGLNSRVNSATAFMVPEILTLSREEVEAYMGEEKGLDLYRHLLDNILRQKDHYLSAAEENIMALAGEVVQGQGNIFGRLNNADLTFPVVKDENGEEVRITHGRYLEFMQSRERRLRKESFTGLYQTYAGFENTFASTLDAAVKGNIFNARARKYQSALEAALDEDNITVELYDNLIKTVSDNLEPFYRYVELRKELLNLDELHMYDLYVPLVERVEIKLPFAEAKRVIKNGLQPLGEEYSEVLQQGLNGGWIDVYENKGKRSGAYSSGCYGVHPYVLLNYNDNLDSVFTMTHEMGHAMHTYYSNEKQPFVYANYRIFVAEVASTLNETLLMHYLLENTVEKEKKRYLINHYLEQFRGTVFRQTMFAEFERIIHQEAEKGSALTAGHLKEIYHQLNEKYYGPEVVIDEEIDQEWERIPHFYYNFYVYKYATGFSAATALAEKILKREEKSREEYLAFLKSGDSDYPVELLKKAGVDMESPAPIEAAVKTFAEFVGQLEELS